MSVKFHTFLVFVGVLLMSAAAGLFVRYGMDGPDPNAAPTGITSDAEPTESAANAPVLPTGTTPTTTPSPTPTATPKATTKPPTTKPPTTKPPTTTRPPATWRLVWSDEFSGAAPDAAKWSLLDGTQVDSACLTSRPENVSIATGSLVLRAAQEELTCGAATTSYSSGQVDSRTSSTYGAFEVRLRAPEAAPGLTAACWLHSGAGDVEVVTAPGGSASVSQGIMQSGTGTAERHSATAAAGFHTYRAEWEPGVIRFYLDGVETYRRDRTTTSWFDSAFAQAHDVRCALRVGDAAGATLPADLTVDYVRIYQR